MKVRDQNNCPLRCMIDCRANLKGGNCKAPYIELSQNENIFLNDSELKLLRFIKENNGQIFQVDFQLQGLLKKGMIRIGFAGYLRTTEQGEDALLNKPTNP